MRGDLLLDAVNIEEMSGPAAPDNPSTDGSRQGSSDQTAQTSSAGLAGWQTPTVSTGAHQQKDGSMIPKLDTQVKQWPTPSGAVVNDGETLESWEARKARNIAKHHNGNGMGTPLTIAVQQQKQCATDKQWATPVTADSTGFPRDMDKRLKDDRQTRDPEKHGNYKMDLKDQVGATDKQWATPRAEMDSGAHNGKPDTLHSQMKVAMMGKLNPRWVETLMGLPVGWTMPSCASPVTIAPTNCASSETGSSRPPQNAPSAS
jgi:hypothetical protein